MNRRDFNKHCLGLIAVFGVPGLVRAEFKEIEVFQEPQTYSGNGVAWYAIQDYKVWDSEL